MQLAERLKNLGTETAFAVSEAAAAWKAQGNKIYPFHLGDINIPTPANIVVAQNQAIAEGKTGYAPAAGIPPLRDALAAVVGEQRGMRLAAENVAVQPGGKPVVTKFIQAVMEPGDEVLYPNPGYPIYESQIEYFRGVGRPYRFLETPQGFQMDMDYLEALITPKTRILFYNNCQNPLGTESSDAEMARVAELAIKHNLWVLSDEAYFEVRYSGQTQSIASLPGMAERTVILYTFSKKYAMTGWRLGAAIGPEPVIQAIARLNTNDESCTTHFVQWAGVAALLGDQSVPRANVEILRDRARCDGGAAAGDRRHPDPQARIHLLSLPECDRGHGAPGLHQCGAVCRGRAQEYRRLVLHAHAFRPSLPRRDAALYPLRLFRHRYAGDSRRSHSFQAMDRRCAGQLRSRTRVFRSSYTELHGGFTENTERAHWSSPCPLRFIP